MEKCKKCGDEFIYFNLNFLKDGGGVCDECCNEFLLNLEQPSRNKLIALGQCYFRMMKENENM